MNRPTLALCCIAKNEEQHTKRFLEAFAPLVDKVYFVDTGSVDKTVDIAEKFENVVISKFEWINDFSAARQFSFDQAKEDYIMWADLDDTIANPDSFIKWRDNSMKTAEMWIANYRYAFDPQGNAVCVFGRERVVKNSPKFKWKYPIHEGIMPSENAKTALVNSWTIDHLRTPEDLIKDKRRNLNIFEGLLENGKLDARMKYYYGKELFENGDIKKASAILSEAITAPVMEIHDRILGIQYACYSFMQTGEYDKVISLALTGLQISPNRAELFVLIGDAYLKKGAMKEAIPYYHAAQNADPTGQDTDDRAMSAIFKHKEAYTTYPKNQLARLYFHLGKFKEAKDHARSALICKPNAESEQILSEISRLQDEMDYSKATDTDDIVFTCLGGLYEWDGGIYRSKGIGGSETACVEMAEWFKKIRQVGRIIVFNTPRSNATTINGVEYRPVDQMYKYFKESKPKLHIAWRHAQKFTEAKTVHWAHDLVVPGLEFAKDENVVIALSDFHKHFISTQQGVPFDKIYVSRNGIDPGKLPQPLEKNAMKVIFSSSPDRELDRVIHCLDIVRLTNPIELHVFYGLDNMIKMGKEKEANYYKALFNDRPWIKYHGNIEQKELYKELQDAALWVYVPTFQETFCITALEMVAMGVYPIVNNVGALPCTLSEFIEKDMCTIVDTECQDLQGFNDVAAAVNQAIETKAWERVKMDRLKYSWQDVAYEWLRDLAE